MKNKHMLVSLFLSYIVLIIPMLGISYFVTDHMIANMQKQVDGQIQQESSSFIRKMEEAMIEYQDKTVMLAATKQLQADKMRSHRQATSEGTEYLGNIKRMDERLYDLVLLYGSNTYMSQGYCKLRTYLKEHLTLKADYVQLGEQVFMLEEPAVMLARGSGWDYLIFHYPFENSRSEDAASINFVIRTQEIYEMLESILKQVSVGIKLTFHSRWQEQSIYLQGDMDQGFGEVDEEAFVLFKGGKF